MSLAKPLWTGPGRPSYSIGSLEKGLDKSSLFGNGTLRLLFLLFTAKEVLLPTTSVLASSNLAKESKELVSN